MSNAFLGSIFWLTAFLKNKGKYLCRCVTRKKGKCVDKAREKRICSEYSGILWPRVMGHQLACQNCIMVEVTTQHGFHKNKYYQYHKSPEISILSLPLSFVCPVHGDMAEHPVCIS